MKNTLQQDLLLPLDKIQRSWIRIPITICLDIFLIITIPVIILTILVYKVLKDVYSAWYYEFHKPCMEGPNKNEDS